MMAHHDLRYSASVALVFSTGLLLACNDGGSLDSAGEESGDEDSSATHGDLGSESAEGGDGDGDVTSPGDSAGDGDGDDDGSDHKDPSDCREGTQIGPRTLRRLTRVELENSLRAVFREHEQDWPGVELGPDSVASKNKFINDHALKFGAQATRELLETAETLATLVAENLSTTLDCVSQADADCARQLIGLYGPRLFRRALDNSELDRYSELHSEIAGAGGFTDASKWTLVALIQSPHAVYRSELGVQADDGFELTAYELASALAFTFSGTAPSESLVAAAEAGELESPERRVEIARELLDSEHGRAMMVEFMRDWLSFDVVTSKTKTTVPDFAEVRDLMARETRAYVDEIVFERSGTAQQLLTEPVTVVDPKLAQYYGFSGGTGASFEVVQRDYGIGILAQGSLMSGLAHSDYTSPTQRGLVLYDDFLCNERPHQPNGVPKLPPADPGVTTTRQRYEELHAVGGCKGCHDLFDPIGFAFEHFDEGGRWRDTEIGLAIDATGYATKNGDEIMRFDGQEDLAQQFAGSRVVLDCMSGLMANYVFAGVETCLSTQESREAFAEGSISIKEYFAQMAAAPHFTQRE